MKALFLFIAMTLSLLADDLKVVIDLTTGDLQTFERKILGGIVAHKTYFEGKLQELDAVVVIHGDAYKFFIKDPANTLVASDAGLLKAHDDLGKRISALAETYDVTFLMCALGMKNKKLTKTMVYDFITPIPNAGIGLIEKQNEGYAYLPVND